MKSTLRLSRRCEAMIKRIIQNLAVLAIFAFIGVLLAMGV
jgi:hypothetical protein